MIKQICILTKSYKHGGYCVAGIDLKTKQWVRLVNSDNPITDEIRKEQMFVNGRSIECFDVFEFDFINNIPNSCQNENWLLNNLVTPKFIKTLSLEEIADILELDNDEFFILNTANSLTEIEVSKVNRSLFVFHVQNLKIEATSYEYYGEIRFKYKCTFDYKGNKYINISLTDPIYRDVLQDGLNLADALIIASLPCIPYNDGSFYKFVAKIIPIDKHISSYMESAKNNGLSSPFVKYDLVVQTQQTPGVVLFENYEQLKASISNGVEYYSKFEYSLDNYQLALKHYKELKHVKSVLEKTKREIVKSYNAPLQVVEKRIEELINLIKVPFKKIDVFIKQNEKESKKYEILSFAKSVAISNGLIAHLDNILNSPSFFESKWLNASCSKSTWKAAVVLKIENAVKDISYILSIQSDLVASVLAHYYQTLSMEMVEEFIISLQQASNFTEKIDKITELPYVEDEQEVEQENVSALITEIRTENLTDFEIVNFVANSINPYTGEVIAGIDELLKEKLIEIAGKIEKLSEKIKTEPIDEKEETQLKKLRDENFPMAWEKWTEEEELKLIEEFKQGVSMADIAKRHNRKIGGISARLMKLGLIK